MNESLDNLFVSKRPNINYKIIYKIIFTARVSFEGSGLEKKFYVFESVGWTKYPKELNLRICYRPLDL